MTPNWLELMVGFCQREDVGAVGVKLYFPDETIQHAGIIVGIGGIAGKMHAQFNLALNQRNEGEFDLEEVVRNNNFFFVFI